MLENGYLFAMNVALAVVILIGVVANGNSMRKARRRRREILDSKQNGIALVTINRAVRQETLYFTIQTAMFITSFSAVFRVSPEPSTSAAFQFYLSTMGLRAFTSMLLMWASWADLRDRERIHTILNKLNITSLQKALAEANAKIRVEPAHVVVDNPVKTETIKK